MKKELILTLSILMSGQIYAQKKYAKMTPLQVMEAMKDDYTIKDPSCPHIRSSDFRKRRQCVRYRDQLKSVSIFNSDEENALNRAHNIRVRDNWIRENANKFAEPTAQEKARLEAMVKKNHENQEEVIEVIDDKVGDYDERVTKMEKLVAKYNEFEGKSDKLKEKRTELEESVSNGDFSEREYNRTSREIASVLADMSDNDEKVKDLEVEIKQLLKEISSDSSDLAQLNLNESRLLGQLEVLKDIAPEEYEKMMIKFNKDSKKNLLKLDKSAVAKMIESIGKEKKFAETLLSNLEDLNKDNSMNKSQLSLFQEQIKLKYQNSLLKKMIDEDMKNQMTLAYEASLDNMCTAMKECQDSSGKISDTTILKKNFLDAFNQKFKESQKSSTDK